MTTTPLRLALLRRLAGDPAGASWRELEDEGHAPAVMRGAEYCGLVRCSSTAEGWRVQLTGAGAAAIAPAEAPAIGRPAAVQLTLF